MTIIGNLEQYLIKRESTRSIVLILLSNSEKSIVSNKRRSAKKGIMLKLKNSNCKTVFCGSLRDQ